MRVVNDESAQEVRYIDDNYRGFRVDEVIPHEELQLRRDSSGYVRDKVVNPIGETWHQFGVNVIRRFGEVL